MKYFIFLSLILSFQIHAELPVSEEMILPDDSFQSPPLNIDGQYHVKEAPVAAIAPAPKKVKMLSASERMKLFRERLEERNKIMVERKMEQIRFQQEMALARKLEQSMNQTLRAVDSIKN